MSSSEARAKWRNKRTNYVINFCAQNNFKLDFLNQGYQLRIENVFDFYPTNGRWHFLPTGERGSWHTDNDLKLVMLEMLDKPYGNPAKAGKSETMTLGEFNRRNNTNLTGANTVTVHDVNVTTEHDYNKWYRRVYRWLRRTQ